MLAKQYRLKRNKDFESTFKKGKAFNGRFLFLKLRRNNLEISRFGFVIGKKASKKSTVRNRVKRLLREVIEARLKKVKPGFDIVILVKPKIITKSYQEIEKDVGELLEKAKLYIRN